MAFSDDRKKRKGLTSTVAGAERTVSEQVPPDRRQEILEYLKLFGYTPDRTILQVHVAGFFKKRQTPGQAEKRRAATKRYGGTTFVVVGRTHDPSIMDLVIQPKKRREESSPGYVGYLWKNKDPQGRPPHEVLPLDFTPAQIHYPQEWKGMFATRGFMVTLHVPASFAKDKNRLTRALYRVGKTADVKRPWNFINEIRGSGYGQAEDPASILKVRLARGEIDRSEYEKLRQILAA